MIQCRHLWLLSLDRSIWKCNSLRTKLKTNKLRCHPSLLTFSPFLMNSRPASAWSGPSCSFPEPEDGVQEHIPTFPGVSPASWGPSSPRRRELSLQQPYLRYFKRQVFLLICSLNSQCWKQTNASEKYFSFSQLWNLGIIFDLPCVLSTRSMYHHSSSLCWNRAILLPAQRSVSSS